MKLSLRQGWFIDGMFCFFGFFASCLLYTSTAGYTAGIGLLIMKFVGFDLIPQLSEEANFPKKNLWKAFVGSIGCTVLIYGLAIIAVGGVVGNEWIDQADIVDPRVADILGMHWLGPVSYTHLDVYKRQVHYPTDILGGWSLGLAFLLAATLICEKAETRLDVFDPHRKGKNVWR